MTYRTHPAALAPDLTQAVPDAWEILPPGRITEGRAAAGGIVLQGRGPASSSTIIRSAQSPSAQVTIGNAVTDANGVWAFTAGPGDLTAYDGTLEYLIRLATGADIDEVRGEWVPAPTTSLDATFTVGDIQGDQFAVTYTFAREFEGQEIVVQATTDPAVDMDRTAAITAHGTAGGTTDATATVLYPTSASRIYHRIVGEPPGAGGGTGWNGSSIPDGRYRVLGPVEAPESDPVPPLEVTAQTALVGAPTTAQIRARATFSNVVAGEILADTTNPPTTRRGQRIDRTGKTLELTAVGLLADRTYFVRLLGRDGFGQTASSNVVEVRTAKASGPAPGETGGDPGPRTGSATRAALPDELRVRFYGNRQVEFFWKDPVGQPNDRVEFVIGNSVHHGGTANAHLATIAPGTYTASVRPYYGASDWGPAHQVTFVIRADGSGGLTSPSNPGGDTAIRILNPKLAAASGGQQRLTATLAADSAQQLLVVGGSTQTQALGQVEKTDVFRADLGTARSLDVLVPADGRPIHLMAIGSAPAGAWDGQSVAQQRQHVVNNLQRAGASGGNTSGSSGATDSGSGVRIVSATLGPVQGSNHTLTVQLAAASAQQKIVLQGATTPQTGGQNPGIDVFKDVGTTARTVTRQVPADGQPLHLYAFASLPNGQYDGNDVSRWALWPRMNRAGASSGGGGGSTGGGSTGGGSTGGGSANGLSTVGMKKLNFAAASKSFGSSPAPWYAWLNGTTGRVGFSQNDRFLRTVDAGGQPGLEAKHEAKDAPIDFILMDAEIARARVYRIQQDIWWDPNFNFGRDFNGSGGKAGFGFKGGDGEASGNRSSGTAMSLRHGWRSRQAGGAGPFDLIMYGYDQDRPHSWGVDYIVQRNMQRNRWYTVSSELTMNSNNQRNGRIRVWVDGVLRLDQGGIRWQSGGDYRVSEFILSSAHGGNAPHARPANDSYLRWRNVWHGPGSW